MNKHTLVVFAGSQEIQDDNIYKELKEGLRIFLEANKGVINKILFGGGKEGVMGLLHSIALDVGITIKGYSIEKYRKYDEGNGVDIDFYQDDYSRIQAFTGDGDIFLALPGGEGTIREIGFVADKIGKDEGKYVFISHLFEDYVNLLNSLESKNMLPPDDLKIKRIEDITTIRI